jgi:hypothetical protein
MHRHGIRRLALVSVVVAALLGGVGVSPSSAKGKNTTTTTSATEYSQNDCETIQNINVEDASNGGYWGKTALNASKAFKDAAADIEDTTLKRSMKTLAGIWKVVAKEKNVIAAARITAKKGHAYGDALSVYTKAAVTCATETFEEETTTTTFDESSSDSSSDSTEDTTSDTVPE